MVAKRTLTAGAILLASVVAANATDITPIMPPAPPPPPPPPAFSWSGGYVGLAAGYAWGDTIWTQTADVGVTPADDFGIGDTQTWPISGWLAGGFAGYNMQFSSIVVGAEVGLNWAAITGTATSVFGAADDVMTTTVRNLVTAVARVGFAANNWLFYARGGYAGGQVIAGFVDDTPVGDGTWTSTVWHHGFQVGGGVEVGLSHNMVLGLEYNFTRLLTTAHTGTEVPGGGTLTYDIGAQFHTVGLRLSILFGGP